MRAKVASLITNLFRPRWLAALPNHVARRRHVLAMAATIPIDVFPAITTFDACDQEPRAVAAKSPLVFPASLVSDKCDSRTQGWPPIIRRGTPHI